MKSGYLNPGLSLSAFLNIRRWILLLCRIIRSGGVAGFLHCGADDKETKLIGMPSRAKLLREAINIRSRIDWRESIGYAAKHFESICRSN